MVSCGGCELAAVTLKISLMKVPPTASPCKLQLVASDPIAGVINLYKKYYVLCCRDLCHACHYSKPFPVLWQAVVHLICNVKENDEASFFSKILTSKLGMLYFARLGNVECCDGRIA